MASIQVFNCYLNCNQSFYMSKVLESVGNSQNAFLVRIKNTHEARSTCKFTCLEYGM